MLNKNLVDYVRGKIAVGYSSNVVRRALLEWGYNTNDVDQAIASSGGVELKEPTKPEKEHDFLNLLFKPTNFFGDQVNNDLRKALKYFFFCFLFFFLVQLISVSLVGVLGGEGFDYVLASALTTISVAFFFLISLLLFFGLLLFVYYILFKYIFKIGAGFSLLLTLFLFGLSPYILVGSINSFLVYKIISIFNFSIGFIIFDVFILWAFFLFSLGLSENLGLSLKKSIIYTFVPALLFIGVILFVFKGALQVSFLWF